MISKYIIIALFLLSAFLLIMDIPLWLNLTGGNSKLWLRKRNFGEGIGIVATSATCSMFNWNFTKEYIEVEMDTGIVSNISRNYMIYSGQILDFAYLRKKRLMISFPFANKKVLYHSSDSIVVLVKTFHKAKAYYEGEKLFFDHLNKPLGLGYEMDTIFLIKQPFPKFFKNQESNEFSPSENEF